LSSKEQEKTVGRDAQTARTVETFRPGSLRKEIVETVQFHIHSKQKRRKKKERKACLQDCLLCCLCPKNKAVLFFHAVVRGSQLLTQRK